MSQPEDEDVDIDVDVDVDVDGTPGTPPINAVAAPCPDALMTKLKLAMTLTQKVRIDDMRTMEGRVEELRKTVRQLEHKTETKRVLIEKREAGIVLREGEKVQLVREHAEVDQRSCAQGNSEAHHLALLEKEHLSAHRSEVLQKERHWVTAAEARLTSDKKRHCRHQEAFEKEKIISCVEVEAAREELKVLGAYVSHRHIQMQRDIASVAAAAKKNAEVTKDTPAPMNANRDKVEKELLMERQKRLHRKREAIAGMERDKLEVEKKLKEQTALVEKMIRDVKWAEECCRGERQRLKELQRKYHSESFRLEKEEAKVIQLNHKFAHSAAIVAHNGVTLRQKHYDLDEVANGVKSEVSELRDLLQALTTKEAHLEALEATGRKNHSIADEAEEHNKENRRRLALWESSLAARRQEYEQNVHQMSPDNEELKLWLEELLWRELEVVGMRVDVEVPPKADVKEYSQDAVDLVRGIVNTHAESSREHYLQNLTTVRDVQAKKTKKKTEDKHIITEVQDLAEKASAFSRSLGKLQINTDTPARPLGVFTQGEVALLQHVTRRERALKMKLRTLWFLQRCPLDAESHPAPRVFVLRLTEWWRSARTALARRRLDVLTERKHVLSVAIRILRSVCPSSTEELSEGPEVIRAVQNLHDSGSVHVAEGGAGSDESVLHTVRRAATSLGLVFQPPSTAATQSLLPATKPRPSTALHPVTRDVSDNALANHGVASHWAKGGQEGEKGRKEVRRGARRPVPSDRTVFARMQRQTEKGGFGTTLPPALTQHYLV